MNKFSEQLKQAKQQKIETKNNADSLPMAWPNT